MTLRDLERTVERRKVEWGFVGDRYVMPNSGETRAAEKRELLRALADIAAERGALLPFEAK